MEHPARSPVRLLVWLVILIIIIAFAWASRARFRDCATIRGELDETDPGGALGRTPEIHGPGIMGRKRQNKSRAVLAHASPRASSSDATRSASPSRSSL